MLGFVIIVFIPPLWIFCLVRFLKMRKKKRIDPNTVLEDRFFEDRYALAKLLWGITSFFMILLLICAIGLIILSYLPISFM